MDHAPRFSYLSKPRGVDTVVLDDFGGGHGDEVAAWVTVGEEVVLQVVAPAERIAADRDRAGFRGQVRQLASAHRLRDRRGERSVAFAFDPPGAEPEVIGRSTPR
jgi:hypothetical protein